MSIRALIATILVVTAAGVVLGSMEVRAPMTASELDAIAPVETVFPQPQAIAWDGAVFGILAGGEGLAVRMLDTGREFQVYAPDNQLASVSEGTIRIRGNWTGISCAYANTVFSGRCTPTVDIVILEPIQ